MVAWQFFPTLLPSCFSSSSSPSSSSVSSSVSSYSLSFQVDWKRAIAVSESGWYLITCMQCLLYYVRTHIWLAAECIWPFNRSHRVRTSIDKACEWYWRLVGAYVPYFMHTRTLFRRNFFLSSSFFVDNRGRFFICLKRKKNRVGMNGAGRTKGRKNSKLMRAEEISFLP